MLHVLSVAVVTVVFTATLVVFIRYGYRREWSVSTWCAIFAVPAYVVAVLAFMACLDVARTGSFGIYGFTQDTVVCLVTGVFTAWLMLRPPSHRPTRPTSSH